MAGKEAWPGSADEIGEDAEAHLQSTRFDNFKALFLTYLIIRDGEEIPADSLLAGYQQHLLEDPNGIATTEAFDHVTNDESNRQLVQEFMASVAVNDKPEAYSRLFEEVVAHLPPNLDGSILEDPRSIAEAA